MDFYDKRKFDFPSDNISLRTVSPAIINIKQQSAS
jgi:hypothetical protein